jgi:arylsulfatase A-like enzyme/dienelactone hydrolase
VVLIFCDDLGYADIGPYGSETPTPNLNRLGRQGVRFTDFYVAQPVCSASRAALMTGRYPNRVGILGALNPKATNGISSSELTMGQMFKSRGYATAVFGKWHLGHLPQFLPTHHGFDEYYGLPYSNDMWPKHPSTTFPPLPLIEGEKVIELDPDQSKLTGEYTRRAVAFIQKNRERPFFLYLAHSMPHVPIFASREFQGRTGRGLYADVIAELDWSVGEVLGVLERYGLDRNTLVIFTSDNGPWLSYGNHSGLAGQLREGKATVFEGGVRVPFLARWPGKIPAGSICREPAMTIDLMPTFARLAGTEMPRDRIIDGKDIWPLLTAQPNAKSPHEAFFFYWNRHLEAVRSDRWKLHVAHDYPVPEPPGEDGRPGKMVTKKIEQELYDLIEDPGETTPTKDADVLKHLLALADKCRADLGDVPEKKPGELPEKLAAFFVVPAAYTNGSSKYPAPLVFNDGKRVEKKEQWGKRRAEILSFWTNALGPWPPMLQKPILEVGESTQRDGLTQSRVRVEIAPTQFVAGILLKPAGKGPFPGIVVPFYEPESSVGQGKQTNVSFGYRLASRGFVTLSIGSPGGDARRPESGEAHCQPLSFLACVAANCHTVLAQMPEVDPKRIGIVGHSYGSKWSMFASCLYEKFACAVWCDGGIVFDESRPNVNYWEPWYLGWQALSEGQAAQRKPGVPSADNPRTGAYKMLVETGHDLHELHALMAPRPFLVSGGSEDPASRWEALQATVAVNQLLGYTNRVGMTNRPGHTPTPESNEQIYAFFEHFLKDDQ